MSLYNLRVKVYDFGQLTGANAGSNTDTAHPITGELIKLVCSGDRTAATGSLFLQTNDLVLITLGSVINTNTTKEKYMSLPAGDIGNYPIVNEVLRLSGASVGTGSLYMFT